jgi:hypothetical protein
VRLHQGILHRDQALQPEWKDTSPPIATGTTIDRSCYGILHENLSRNPHNSQLRAQGKQGEPQLMRSPGSRHRSNTVDAEPQLSQRAEEKGGGRQVREGIGSDGGSRLCRTRRGPNSTQEWTYENLSRTPCGCRTKLDLPTRNYELKINASESKKRYLMKGGWRSWCRRRKSRNPPPP